MHNQKTPHSIDISVGMNVRKLRMHRGLSQEALAEKLGLTFQQVQKYEKGANRISASKLVMIASALGCTLPDLFDGVEGDSDPIRLPQLSTTAVRAATLFDKLPSKSHRDAILKTMGLMASEDIGDEAA